MLAMLLATVSGAIAGCGGFGPNGDTGKAETGDREGIGEERSGQSDDPLAYIVPAAVTDTATAITDISGMIKSFKTAVESGDREDAMRLANEIAAIWKAIEPDVRLKQPRRSEQINNDLSALLTAAGEPEWDKTLLIDLDYSLYQGFRDLKQSMD